MKLSVAILSSTLLAQSGDSHWVERLAFWMRSDLLAMESRLLAIDSQLKTLPALTQINSAGSIGFKTDFMPDEEELWVEVTLPEPTLIDSIVLVPPLAKGATGVVSGYGFPIRYRIDAFDDSNQPVTVVDATRQDVPNPEGYPVLANFAPIQTRRVRLTTLVPWQRDGAPVLALAEMFIFSGNRNVTLGATVSSTSSREYTTSWARRNLIDHITPLGLPVVPSANTSLGFHSNVAHKADEPKSVTLEFPEPILLEEVRLIPVRRREVPLWYDYGFPARFKVETASTPDFNDSKLIYETTTRSPALQGMNPFCLPANNTLASYLRITATQLWQRHDDFVFALAEVQAFAIGKNAALAAKATASDALADPNGAAWSVKALTDGLTDSGPLIELPEWFSQLDSRRVLEQERASLTHARTALIARTQHQLVSASIGSVAGISLLSMLLLWRQWTERRRDAQRLQEKLARDLHDEIGSNLGSITLICSMAAQSDATLDTMRTDIADIERVASETADSMRDMVHLISPRRTDEGNDWLGVLRALIERLLRGVSLDLALPAAHLPFEPDLETRRELYLFCKEVLHNISRHANATQVRFHLSPTPKGLRIEIADNGIGFDSAAPSFGHGLGNLRERAAVIKANLQITSRIGIGTSITLDLPRNHRWRKPET
jgi:signal transduction histidine kinase